MKDYLTLPPSMPFRLDTLASASSYTALAADIDGDGCSELIVYNIVDNTFGILSWMQDADLDPSLSTQSGRLLNARCYSQVLPGGWSLKPSDLYCAADIDADGADELIVINPDLYMAVLKWQSPDLSVKWSTSGTLGAYQIGPNDRICPGTLQPGHPQPLTIIKSDQQVAANLAWGGSGLEYTSGQTFAWPSTITTSTQFCSADIDGDGEAEIVAVTPGFSWVETIKWASESQLIKIAYAPVTAAQSGPQYCIANVDGSQGDKRAEIVIFDAQTTTLSVYQYPASSTSFPVEMTLLSSSSTVSGDWHLTSDDVFCAADVNGDGGDELVVLSTSSHKITVLEWTGSGFSVPEGATEALPADWQNAESFQLYAADTDGDRCVELIGFSPSDNSEQVPVVGFVLKWNATTTPIIWSTRRNMPAWSPEAVCSVAVTPFTPFTGTQLDIYQYVSGVVDPNCGHDVRATYANELDKLNFAGWASTATVLQNPGKNPANPAETWSDADWSQVAPVIAAELNGAAQVWALHDARANLVGALRDKQETDFDWVTTLITLAPPDNTTVPYWLGAVFDACIWALAVVPEAKMGQAALALGASLLGSFASDPSSAPAQIQYGEQGATYRDNIEASYEDAMTAAGQQLQTIVTDPVKLRVVSQLADGPWEWPSSNDFNTTLANQAQVANRIFFYQQLIPLSFHILYWNSLFFTRSNEGVFAAASSAGEAAYMELVKQEDDDTWWNVRILCVGDGESGTYPSSEMMSDIFNALGVDKVELFWSQNAWQVIKQVSGK